jgi:hypothetical protein
MIIDKVLVKHLKNYFSFPKSKSDQLCRLCILQEDS